MNRINSLFIKGYTFEKGEIEKEKIKKIEKDENLIDIKRENIYKCVNTKDKDYKNLKRYGESLSCEGIMKEINGSLICQECGREGDVGEKNVVEKRMTVSAVNYIKLNKVVERALDAIKKDNDKIKSVKKTKENNERKLDYSGIKLKIKLLDNASGISKLGEMPFFDKGSIFIGFSSKYFIDVSNGLIIDGIGLINDDFDTLKDMIKNKALKIKEKK